ncbi:MAG TPA: ABC transporter ATP-binding protein [bacterium]
MNAGAPLLEVRGLRVRKGGADLLDVRELAVAAGETLSLIGPNGAGKSTLLLALSGIEAPAAGELRFRGERVPGGAAALAFRRRVAMVFQEPLLFDTTVFGNVASGLRLRGLDKAEIDRRVRENLERFRVEHLASRSARTLSGGEAQRTSLARAMAVTPEVLLLDEPFAALDPLSREGLLEDLAHTLRETGTTTIFATHDRIEAQRIADRVAVLDCGRLRQVGAADEVLRRPADAFVAAFVGVENLLPVRMTLGPSRGGLCAVLERGGAGAGDDAGPAVFEVGGVAPGLADGASGLLCVRPEDLVVTAVGEGGGSWSGNHLTGRVVKTVPQGPLLKATIDCGVPIVAAVPGQVTRALALEPGLTVRVGLRPADLYVIPGG